MSEPSQGRGRGQATVSIPTDAIISTAPANNNNQSQETEGAGAGDNPPQIGVAPESYNIHESVLYTHGYYTKIKKEDGTIVAKCNMCWEKSKDTVVTRRITDSSTKGLSSFSKCIHSFSKFSLSIQV